MDAPWQLATFSKSVESNVNYKLLLCKKEKKSISLIKTCYQMKYDTFAVSGLTLMFYGHSA